MAKMKILISGGAGFIGSYVINAALKNNIDVIILKKKQNKTWKIDEYLDKIHVYNLEDIDLNQIFKKHVIDAVIHLAAKYIKYEKTKAQRQAIYASNVVFANDLLKASINNHVKGFINTGTFFEYQLTNLPIHEKITKNPFNYYSQTKIQFEKNLIEACQQKQIKAITLKLFSPYGEKDDRAVIYLMTRALITSTPLFLSSGQQRLSFTYAGDIAEAYIKALKFLMSTKINEYQDFNIGDSRIYSIREIAKILIDYSRNKNIVLNFNLNSKTGDEIEQALCDNSKAKQYLGWNPEVSITKGLKKVYDYWYKKNIQI